MATAPATINLAAKGCLDRNSDIPLTWPVQHQHRRSIMQPFKFLSGGYTAELP